jgi:hypothetical protein
MKKVLLLGLLAVFSLSLKAQTTTNIFNTLDANAATSGFIFRVSATSWANGRKKIEAVDPISLFSAGSGISISGAGVIAASDPSVTNEIQALSISGNTVSLSNGGGSVTLPTASAPDGSETKLNAGTNITLTGAGTTASPYVVNAANMFQTMSISGKIISLTGSASVTLPKQWTYKTHVKNQVTATLALPATVPSTATDIGIYIGGLKMTPTTDNYTVSGSTLTFVGGAPNMDVEIWYNE